MQQHSAEHIVSGLVKERFGYDNVGFHLGTENSTLDFNGEITQEQLKELQWRANELVVENLDIIETYPTKEEVESMEFRSKIELDEGLRIIIIPDVDQCACCAPQLKKTGEIGLIKLTNMERYKGGVRITMLCGFRALEDYTQKEKSVKSISTLLSAKEKEVFQAVELLKDEVESWKQKNYQLSEKLIQYKAREIPDSTKIVCLFEEDLTGEGPRHLMNLVLEQGKEVCGVFYPDNKDGYRYTIGSKSMDVSTIGKNLNERFQGRGGGKPNMVQGSIKGEEDEIRKWFLATC
jgi:alanyl-tRNA synthetase